MTYTDRITWEPLRKLDSSTLGGLGTYTRIGTALSNQSYITKMVNLSNVDVEISIDGTTSIDILPAGGFWLYDNDTSVNPNPEGIPKGTQLFVSGSSGTGYIYLVTLYIVSI